MYINSKGHASRVLIEKKKINFYIFNCSENFYIIKFILAKRCVSIKHLQITRIHKFVFTAKENSVRVEPN